MSLNSSPSWPADLAVRWDGESPPSDPRALSFNETHKLLDFLDREHYHQYIPTAGPEYDDFQTRFALCLDAISGEDDRKLFFRFAPRITFLGRQEFIQLYRSSFSGPITRWIIDETQRDFLDPALYDQLPLEAHRHTWYCPLTDSMPISEFHHANHLGGVDLRPDWRSLAAFADAKLVENFMANQSDAQGLPAPLRRLVVLEDFVGSGTQMRTSAPGQHGGALDFAARSLPSIPILFVPLVICPEGLRAAEQLATIHSNLRIAPILVLGEQDMVVTSSDPLFIEVRKLAQRLHQQVVGDGAEAPRPYDIFGFANTGATVVLHHNTPANTLPLLQHQSSTWRPLFPRSARIR